MRAVFYVYMCLLLFCAGRLTYAGMHDSRTYSSSTRGPLKKLQVKLNSTDTNDSTLDDADLDTDDDYKSDLDEDGGPHHFLSIKYNLAFEGCLTCAVQLLSTHYNKRFKILPPICGDSAPIYIRQRVLRV